MSKYSPKYAKQLIKGLRLDGKSVVEVCALWGIGRQTWYHWIDKHPEFAEAVAVSEVQCEAKFAKGYRDVMEGKAAGNAGMYVNAAKYILGWDGKPEQAKEEVNDIKVLRIEIMQPRSPQLVHENNVIDISSAVMIENKPNE